MNGVQEKVYNYIKKHKPAKQNEIAKGLGLDTSAVSKAVAFLEGAGKVDYFPAKYEIRK